MPQEAENYVKTSDAVHLIPTASVDILPGDVVMMSARNDPASLVYVNATPGRIRPMSAAYHAKWVVGVLDGRFTSAVYGATDYAAPTQQHAQRVIREGIVRLALTNTAGQAGSLVRYSSGAAGAQLFVIDNRRPGWAIGRIAKTFSGATANDPQYVELALPPLGGPSLLYFLENRVLHGCFVKAGPGNLSNVAVGHSTTSSKDMINLMVIQNQAFSVPDDATLAFGGNATLGATSTVAFKWVVGRSGTFAVRSASGTKAALASFTNSGVTAALLAPVTMTAAEIPIALLIRFSAGAMTIAKIKQIRGPGIVPRVGVWGI